MDADITIMDEVNKEEVKRNEKKDDNKDRVSFKIFSEHDKLFPYFYGSNFITIFPSFSDSKDFNILLYTFFLYG